MLGFTHENLEKAKSFLEDLAIHAAFGAAGAGVAYAALHLDSLGVSGIDSTLIGAFLGSLASRLQARAAK